MRKFRPNIPVCDGPLIETADELRAWAEVALPGDRCVYGIGPHCGNTEIANRARKLQMRGCVTLFQRRLNRLEFGFIAERISTGTLERLNELQITLSGEPA